VVWDSESGSTLASVASSPAGFPHAADLAARPDGGVMLAVGQEGDTPARLLRLDLLEGAG
jgi:hypothetical protein